MTAPTITECPDCGHLPHDGRCPGYANCGCDRATIADTPESAIADGRCSYDADGAPVGRFPYRACGRMPVVATWYARQWPGRSRTVVSALCAVHDRYAQRASADAAASIGGRMYEREGI